MVIDTVVWNWYPNFASLLSRKMREQQRLEEEAWQRGTGCSASVDEWNPAPAVRNITFLRRFDASQLGERPHPFLYPAVSTPSCILALGSLIPMMFPCKSFWSAMFCMFTAHITQHVYLIHLPTGTHFTFVVHRSQGCQGSSQNVFHMNHQVAHLFQTRPVRRAATVAPSAESRRTMGVSTKKTLVF